MKKFLYIMPAVLIGMVYILLFAIAGSISGIQPVAVVNILFPILAGVLLRKGNWWGCLFGIAMAAVVMYSGITADPRMTAGLIAGLILAAYYVVMGLLCAADKNKA